MDAALIAVAGLALLWSSYAAYAARRDAGVRRASVDEARRELESFRAKLVAVESRAGDATLARQTLHDARRAAAARAGRPWRR